MPFGKKCGDPTGARRHERFDRTLRDGYVLVRPAGAVARADGPAADRRCGEREERMATRRRMRRSRTPSSHVTSGASDTVGGKQIFPAERGTGRKTRGTSSFRLRLDPKNVGVMLRRKLDYALPNQRAEVYVAGSPDSAGRFAGIWYLAGSNSPVYSDPKEELGATQHVLDTSNRRFRDDEFLIPRELTRGRRSIWVRVKFTPVNRPLYPGHPPGEQAWSEMRYTAYCFVVPKFAAEFVRSDKTPHCCGGRPRSNDHFSHAVRPTSAAIARFAATSGMSCRRAP